MPSADRYLSYQKLFNGSVTASPADQVVLASDTDIRIGGASLVLAEAITISGSLGVAAPVASLSVDFTEIVLSNPSVGVNLTFAGDNSIVLYDGLDNLHDFTEASIEFADASGFTAADVTLDVDEIHLDVTDVTLAAGDRIQLSLDFAANAAPEFTSAATASVAENSTAVLDLTTSDADEDAVSFAITGGADAAKFEIDGDNQLSFVTAPDFDQPGSADGTNSYKVEVTADDGWGGKTVQNIAVTVTGTNEVPVAGNDGANTAEDSATANLIATLLANDSDPDGDSLHVVSVDATSTRGLVDFDMTAQTLVYDPNGAFDSLREGQTDTDSFTYTISDGELTATAVATVIIDGVDTAPVVIVGTPGNDSLTDLANVNNTIWGDRLGTLTGRGGNDRIFGRGGDDDVSGDAETIAAKGRGGNDVIQGGSGNDDLYGDATGTLSGIGGNDVLQQGAGTGVLVGDALALAGSARGGNDQLTCVGAGGGGSSQSIGVLAVRPPGAGLYGDAATTMSGSSIGGNDTLNAAVGSTASHLFGDARALTDSARGGNDALAGGSAADVLAGDAQTLSGATMGGADRLSGNGGNDTLFGDGETLTDHSRGGADVLRGGAGDDAIYGDGAQLDDGAVGGNDQIYSGAGDDEIWGDGEFLGRVAGGRDRLYFDGGFGDDQVLDFRQGEDKLVFGGLRPSELQITVDGADMVLTTLGDDSVTLVGFTGALRNGVDILFA